VCGYSLRRTTVAPRRLGECEEDEVDEEDEEDEEDE